MGRPWQWRLAPTWRGDALAGLTVAVLLVPQAMAYAMLAGLPPVAGLYASTLPLVLYALLGTSRQLAVGPVAMLALLTAGACASVAEPGSPEYLAAAGVLTLLAALLQVVLGAARAGRLTHFVSHAVISGFTSAGAIVICLSQAGPLLGLSLGAGPVPLSLLYRALRRLPEANLPTLALGAAAFGVLQAVRWKWPRAPAALLVVAGGALAVYFFDLADLGVQVVGAVPGGLPSFSPPSLDADLWRRLLPSAGLLVFVGYMESLAVARWIAAREDYRLNPNRELLALGAANLAAGLFSGCPVTGGFSRTALNYQAGARSSLAGLVTAAVVVATLAVLTPLFYHLPQSVLAAVILSVVVGLFRPGDARRLYRVKRSDGHIWLATFAVTLGWGVEQGLLAGILLSLAVFIARSAHPRTVVLGYVPQEDAFRDMQRYPEARGYPEMLILRVDSSLYFANMEFVLDRLREHLSDASIHRVIIDVSGVNAIDAVAALGLAAFMDQYAPRGIAFAFVGLKRQVRDVVMRAGWQDRVGDALDFRSLHQALRSLCGAPP